MIDRSRRALPSGRGILLRLASLAVGVAAAALLLAVVVSGYVLYCRQTGTDARRLTRFEWMRRVFADEAYLELLRLVTAESPDAFDTVWDATDSVKLARAEFVPTEMYGRTKFRYRPFLRYVDAEVWSGLDRQRLSALDSGEVRRALGRCRVYRQVFIETDANGFKKTEFAPQLGTPVVLFVGDSFTEGLDVASPDTFVNLFGRRMRDAGLRAIPVNAGVNGYGALEEAWTVENYAVALGARLVIANLFPNDVALDYSKVVSGAFADEAAYAEMFGYLDLMRNHCRSLGIVLVVAAIPAREQLGPHAPASPFDARVRAWCASRGLRFLSPLAVFRARGAETIYFPVDPHLSEGGHAVYASFLFESLRPLLHETLGPRPATPDPL